MMSPPSDGICVSRWVCGVPERCAVMSEVVTVGDDLEKTVFQVHGAFGTGRAVLRKTLRRAQVLECFKHLRPCVVAMEARGGAHFGGVRSAGCAMMCD